MLTEKQLKNLQPKDRVRYLPPGKLFTESITGLVSRIDEVANYVYVKMENNFKTKKWEEVAEQACRPGHLTLLPVKGRHNGHTLYRRG